MCQALYLLLRREQECYSRFWDSVRALETERPVRPAASHGGGGELKDITLVSRFVTERRGK